MILRLRHTPMPILLLLSLACAEPDPTDTGSESPDTDSAPDDTDTDEPTDTAEEEEDHPLGVPVPDFALTDINPSSPSYGQVIDSSTMLGAAYSVIFLDSRCTTCEDVIEDMWMELEAKPTWKEALPLYAIQSVGGAEMEKTHSRMIDDNDMPYLQDTEETGLWLTYEALNHDFFAVSAEGTLDVWLPLYIWPGDLAVYQEYMTTRFGE
jgi:hypothetical protein